MREHLGFLKTSSAVVKIAAWIFLFLGIIGGVSVILGTVPTYPRWMGFVILAIYAFFFFFFFLIAKIADLLVRIINAIGARLPDGQGSPPKADQPTAGVSSGNEIKKE